MEQRFCYKDQRINIGDIVIFIVMLILNIGLFFASFVITSKGELDYAAKLVTLILAIIFNAPIIAYFTLKVLSMIRFKRKINRFKANGKKLRAKIIDEKLGKPLMESEIETIYTYYPVVKFFDSETQKEITLTSNYPMCASYEKALSLNSVTIYVIGEDFLIFDFAETDDKDYSLERRTSKGRKIADVTEKIYKIRQITYGIGMLIFGLILLGIQVLKHFLLG